MLDTDQVAETTFNNKLFNLVLSYSWYFFVAFILVLLSIMYLNFSLSPITKTPIASNKLDAANLSSSDSKVSSLVSVNGVSDQVADPSNYHKTFVSDDSTVNVSVDNTTSGATTTSSSSVEVNDGN